MLSIWTSREFKKNVVWYRVKNKSKVYLSGKELICLQYIGCVGNETLIGWKITWLHARTSDLTP